MGGGAVIRSMAEWLIVAFVVFALLFEILLHKMEHWINEKHHHLQSMIRNLYRELIIMGVISFAFIMYIFIGNPSADVKMTFKVAHVFLFLFAVFHSIIVSIAILISMHLSSRWKSMERMDLIKYLDNKEQYRRLTEKRDRRRNFIWRHFIWWLPDPRDKLEFGRLHEIMTFHDNRFQFISYRNLAPDFKFSKFLRKVKFVTFIELAEINPINWIILLCLVIADIVRAKIGSHPDFEAFYLMAHSVFNVSLVFLLSRKIRSIHWKMTKNPAIYYDSIDPEYFRGELKNAEEESRSSSRNASKSSVSFADTSGELPDRSRVCFAQAPRGVSFEPEIEESPDSSISRDFEIADAAGGNEPYSRPTLRHMGPTALNLLDKAKNGHGSKDGSNNAPISLDMSVSMPEREIENRERGYSLDMPVSQELEIESLSDCTDYDLSKMQRLLSKRKTLKKEALRRLRQRKKTPNAAMAETRKNVEMAKASSPSRQYPKWLVKLFPRIGRVASVTEKLFWFGSHRFYLFCVENTLFFTNANLSTCLAKVAFLKETAEYNKYNAIKKVATAAKFALAESVRAAADTKSAYAAPKKPTENLNFLLIALGMAVIALSFVLYKIAGIMKKYIFVLNNANLLPEEIMLETIEHVNIKNSNGSWIDSDKEEDQDLASYDSDSGRGNDDGPTDFGALRRKMTTFIAQEQGGGV